MLRILCMISRVFFFVLAFTSNPIVGKKVADIADRPEFTDSELRVAAQMHAKHEITMSVNETALLSRFLNNANVYFEFGCGGSTAVAAAIGTSTNMNLAVHIIDTSAEWLTNVQGRESVRDLKKLGRFSFQHINLGPTTHFGVPSSPKHKPDWPKYSQAIVGFTIGSRPVDLTLVDGRFRLACVVKTFLTQPQSIVLVHDFYLGPKSKYKSILEVANIKTKMNALVQLVRKPNVTDAELDTLYDKLKMVMK